MIYFGDENADSTASVPSAMPASNTAHSLTRALKEIEERYGLFHPQQRRQPLPVVVGVSGGADSLCLLHLLHTLAEEWRLQPHVAHLDHAVRPESAQDAAFVADVAHAWKRPFHSRRLEQSEIGAAHPNLEAALRQLRYGFLADVAEQVSSESGLRTCIAVAHTREDQTETLLMHIFRGSGLDGLAGMQHRSPIHASPVHAASADALPIDLLRPLLTVSRTDILQYLNDHRIAWREDPSNRDFELTRNRLRHLILPQLRELYPELDTALGNLAEIMAAEGERARHADAGAFFRIWQNQPAFPQPAESPQYVLDWPAWRWMDLASRRGVLQHGLKLLALPPEEITFARIERLRIALEEQRKFRRASVAGDIQCSAEGKRFSLHPASAFAFPPGTPVWDDEAPEQQRVILANETLSLGHWQLTCREIEPTQLPDNWQRNGDRWQAWLDADQVSGLALTAPRPGMRFAPLGLDGHHKLLGDFFTDRRVDPDLRPLWPLVVDAAGGEIVWVCGLRLAHPFRVQEHTTRILHLHWSKQ